MTWEEIEKEFDQEWIELIDYDWPEGDYNPRSGVVRTHSPKREEFYERCSHPPVPSDSAILFVGKKSCYKEGVFFVPNLSRISICEK